MKVEADDYGNGKYDTGICYRIGNQAGYHNLLDGERHVNIFNLKSSILTRFSRYFDWAKYGCFFSDYSFHVSSRSQFKVKSILTVEMTFNLVM